MSLIASRYTLLEGLSGGITTLLILDHPFRIEIQTHHTVLAAKTDRKLDAAITKTDNGNLHKSGLGHVRLRRNARRRPGHFVQGLRDSHLHRFIKIRVHGQT